jgi:hypothetical protein
MISNPKRCKARLYFISWPLSSIQRVHKNSRVRRYGSKCQNRGTKINNLQHADDNHSTSIKQGTYYRTHKKSQKRKSKDGSQIEPKENRVMSTGEQVNIFVDGDKISTVKRYGFSGISPPITATPQTRSREKHQWQSLQKLLKTRDFRPTQKLS